MLLMNLQKQNQVSFGIRISPQLIKSAEDFYSKKLGNRIQYNAFNSKVRTMQKSFGFDNYVIVQKYVRRRNERFYALFVERLDGKFPKIITLKDSLQKLYEKFIQINEENLCKTIKRVT